MKINSTKTTKRVAAIILAAFAACSVMGCSVEKNFTTTETHTVTDADGNTTTTTTTNHNGEVTTETTTTTAGEMDVEEVSEAVMYEKVPVAFTNNMGWDIKDFSIKMSNQDEWSDNFLSEDQYIDHDTTANGITVNYNEDQHFMDIRVADSNGDGEEFTEIELPAEGADSIEVVLGYDEVNGTYTATVNAV
ncbi:MAG: hypothetical protein Q4D29_06245 [Lachnospiraceae bacterium]|nr:hypothetical protein [Lachnospiraceae bacterium]